MSDDRYEFSYISTKEKRKLLAARIFLIASIIYSLWSLITKDYYAEGVPYYDAAWILTAVFAYINVLKVKSELVELFEMPLDFKALEFLVASVLFTLIGAYQQFA
tara:strand:- start:7325 stop:7639 length:315 start_codon:yes stop_codon:yes gene_type:complete